MALHSGWVGKRTQCAQCKRWGGKQISKQEVIVRSLLAAKERGE